ncbi:hypothetical protein, partial [Escherichia coli]|uniref:hypothetical protein n=1 Tax=Escherichia coli TaxID=562 RepID=UPI00307A2E42
MLGGSTISGRILISFSTAVLTLFLRRPGFLGPGPGSGFGSGAGAQRARLTKRHPNNRIAINFLDSILGV